MVQENYVASLRSNKSTIDEQLEALMGASEYISESDVLNSYVRKEMVCVFLISSLSLLNTLQRWDLLTKQAAMNVGACLEAQGFVGRPEFSRLVLSDFINF